MDEENLELALNFTAPPEDSSRYTLKLCLSIAYCALWIIGSIGNGIVIVMIINVLTSMKRKQAQRRKQISGNNTNHVFIYILGLSIVDFLVIMHLPFLVADLLQGQWLFGSFMCKIYWFGESVNKLLSSFIMTVLSWDRYLAVCSPVASIRIRSNNVSVVVLVVSSLFATVLLIPVLTQTTVFKIDKMLMIPLEEESEELRQSDMRGTTMRKCMFDADPTFTLYTFVIGFLLPALLITLFYTRVIFKVQKNSKSMRALRSQSSEACGKKENDRVKIVTKRIVAVIVFYYFCWTPQWALNLMTQFNMIHASWMTPALSAVFFIAHLLVCFNSAANPVLYALINRELRQQHVRALQKKRQSVSLGAREFLQRQRHGHHRNSAMSVVSVSTIKEDRSFFAMLWVRFLHIFPRMRRRSFDAQSNASNGTRASIEEMRTKTDGFSTMSTVPEIVICDSGDDYL